MSILSVYPQFSPQLPSKVLTHAEDIASTLAEVGVLFARWPLVPGITAGNSAAEIICAYQSSIDHLFSEEGSSAVDVLGLASAPAQTVEMREQFLREHSHNTALARLFVAGRGLFAVHIGEQVFEVLCEKGDLLSLPVGTRHWFDLGEKPDGVFICLLGNVDEAAAQFTGESIAEQFTRLETWF
jgi:1,2-dihydroxy-3-keto-5-methylthiopentene dioxygenase